MTGWQILLAQAALFLVAVGGITFFSLMALRFAGPAMNKNRAAGDRARHWLAAAGCVAGIVASAGIGFSGIAALLYIAKQ